MQVVVGCAAASASAVATWEAQGRGCKVGRREGSRETLAARGEGGPTRVTRVDQAQGICPCVTRLLLHSLRSSSAYASRADASEPSYLLTPSPPFTLLRCATNVFLCCCRPFIDALCRRGSPQLIAVDAAGWE